MASDGLARAALIACALAAGSCAPPLLKLPSGQGTPTAAADAAAALASATAACRGIKTMTADVAVTGSASGRRVRARLLVGVETPASVRIEATAPFGAPFFIFVARDRDATLLLPRDGRVLEHGPPEAVLDAVAGIPLTAADLDAALTRCVVGTDVKEGTAFDDAWLKIALADARTVFLRRASASAAWRISVVSTSAWRIDYPGEEAGGAPATVRVVSVDAGGRTGGRFNVQLSMSQVDVNTPLDAAVFRVEVPAAAVPITLDELRHANPGVRED